MSLDNTSLTKLRGIAQSLGVDDVFKKNKEDLIQAIRIKQADSKEVKAEPIPHNPFDARLMTATPSDVSEEDEIREVLKEHTARGLHIEFPSPEQWHMTKGGKEDSGTTRQPLLGIVRCADKLLLS